MSYHSYIFFDAEPTLHAVPKAQLEKDKKTFAGHLERSPHVKINAYATLGFEAGTRFMLHMSAETPEAIQELLRDLLHTPLGAHLRVSYTLLGMTRSSQYNPSHAAKEDAPSSAHKYLIVYPFTKTIEWHFLPFDERRKIMKAHVDIGHKFTATISQLLLYSYGLDDHEFIVSYYTDKLEDFQNLVMAMRETESRRHTKNDTPIFMCIHKSFEDALTMI
jgi:chlorite dismutase